MFGASPVPYMRSRLVADGYIACMYMVRLEYIPSMMCSPAQRTSEPWGSMRFGRLGHHMQPANFTLCRV